VRSGESKTGSKENLLGYCEGPVFPSGTTCDARGVHSSGRTPGSARRVGADEEVMFLQTSALENRHRDAVRFRTGHTLRLQELTVGQRVQVIDLGNKVEEQPNVYAESSTSSRTA
jgi:hypothetical protein